MERRHSLPMHFRAIEIRYRLFFEHLFAPRALSARGASQVARGSLVHCPKCLRIAGDELMTAILAFVCAHTYLELERIKAGNQKHNAKPDDRDELPYSLGHQKGGKEDPREKRDHADEHNDPHRGPDHLVFLLQFP